MTQSSPADEVLLADVRMDGVGFSQVELADAFCVSGPEGDLSLCYLLRRGVVWLQIEGLRSEPMRLEAGAIVAFSGLAKHWFMSGVDGRLIDPVPMTLRSLRAPIATDVELFVGHAPLQSLAFASLIGGAVVIPAAAAGMEAHRIWGAFHEIEAESMAAESVGCEHLMIRRYAEIMLLNIVRWVARRRRASRSAGLSAMSDIRIMKALAAVARAPFEAWTATRLAGEAGMSRAAFFEQFRTLTGDTPGRAILKFRLRRAAAELTQGNDKVEEVAARAGFSSSAAFIRAFRSVYGEPPMRWRSRHRGHTPAPDGGPDLAVWTTDQSRATPR